MMRKADRKKAVSVLLTVVLLIGILLTHTSNAYGEVYSFSDAYSSEVLVTLEDDIEDVSIAEEIASKYGYEVSGILEWNSLGKKTVIIDTLEPEGPIAAQDLLLAEESVKDVECLGKYVKHLLKVAFSKEVKDEETARQIIAPYSCELLWATTEFAPLYPLYASVKISEGANIWSVRRDLLSAPSITGVFLCGVAMNKNAYAVPPEDDAEIIEETIENTEESDNINKNDNDRVEEPAFDGIRESTTPQNSIEWDNLQPGKDYVDGELLVVFDDTIENLEQASEIVDFCGCEVKKEISWTGDDKMLLVSVIEATSVSEAMTKFEGVDSVQYTQLNIIYRLSESVRDRQTGSFWHLDKIGAYDAWNFAQCNGDVAVAVISGGVELEHPDLEDVINTDYAWDISNNCPLQDYYSSEGTECAGIISAISNNSIGASGVSYNAQIIPINVMWNINPDLTTSDLVVSAYNYLINNVTDVNLRVVDLDYSEIGGASLFDSALSQKIQQAASLGIATVCPGGDLDYYQNNSYVYPSDYDACISVTVTDSYDCILSSCIGGNSKDIAAPGASIYTTTTNSGYTTVSGTNAAAAVVSGVLALMFAANDDLTVDEAKYILYSTAVDYTPAVTGVYYGAGRVDAKAAVRRAMNGPWTRLYGSSRYYTMKEVSNEGWEDDSCQTVIVATGATFPDALSGSALAGLYDSPIILTKPDVLSVPAQDELIRLDPDNVIILGSTNAISSDVENAIKAIVGNNNVTRVYGNNRYETSKAIYDAGIGNWSDTLILATGTAAPDALSIAPYAYASGSPIFLVRNDNTPLSASMQAVISSGVFDRVVIVGAPEVVSSSVESWVKSQVGNNNVIRLYGSNRYQTSSAVAEWETGNMQNAAFDPDTTLTYTYPSVANGGDDHFADALSGSALCGRNGSVLLLTKDLTTSANYTVQNNIIPHRTEISNGFVLGASQVLSVDFLDYLNTVTVQ